MKDNVDNIIYIVWILYCKRRAKRELNMGETNMGETYFSQISCIASHNKKKNQTSKMSVNPRFH